MNDVAIRVDHLGKQYSLGLPQQRYSTVRDQFKKLMFPNTLFGRGRPSRRRPTFWALKDLSFEISSGEVVGIIGRNGAGKSTLLKILSRITEPTIGEADIYGRVGSLLEVGTGFHPELSGRENIFLNGAIMGMKRAEIARKFDEIIDFAEVEPFVDTPVKHYSSGMYMRLAFAVAAHLEPEILIIDEVLAVGDLQFQNKCLGRMSTISRQGRTILFVSHNMNAIQTLCPRTIALSEGMIVADGPTRRILEWYVENQSNGVSSQYDLSGVVRKQDMIPLIQVVRLKNDRGEPTSQIFCGSSLFVELDLRLPEWFELPQVGIGVDDSLGQRIFSVATHLSPDPLPPAKGDVTVHCKIDEIILAPGRFTLSLSVGNKQNPLLDEIQGIASFNVIEADFYRNGQTPNVQLGQVLVRSKWNLTH